MKDAKQVTKIDEKPSNILAEYYDILTCPSCFYVRWMWILGFPIGIYGSYWINTVLYWLFISYGLAQEDYGIFAVISAFTGLIVSCCCNCFWGIGYFGKKSKKGREYSINPRNYAIAFTVIAYAISQTVYWTLYRPLDRQTLLDGGKNDWVKLYLGGVITGFWGFPQSYWSSAAWQWAIDFDNQSRHKKGHKRREAVIGALSATISAVCTVIGRAIAQSLFLGNNPLCDTTLQPGYQKEECYMTLYYSYFYPTLFLFPFGLAGMYFYPIKGEKLKQLYRKQGDYQDAIQHTDSWATVVQATPIQTLNPSNVSIVQQNSQPDVVQPVVGNPLVVQQVVQQVVKQTVPVTIPEGAEPGMVLEIPLSNGTKLKFEVPQDKKPGDVCQVPV